MKSDGSPVVMYVPDQFMDPGKRELLLPILRPFYKSEDYTDLQRITDYGLSEHDFQLTAEIEEADIIAIPMAWEYYKKKGLEADLIGWLEQHDETPAWGWNSGDFGVDIPVLPENVIIYRLNGYNSIRKPNERGMPPFFKDPVRETPGWKLSYGSAASPEITVGFCGQSKGNLLKYGLDVARTITRNTRYYMRISPYQPHDVIPSTWLRQKALGRLSRDKAIRHQFIQHKKYRAGATNSEERSYTRRQFLQNISNNDYTVCVRGGGNFSVRLFETMALGRIPVQVDTDCLYPLPELIDWKAQTCFIEKGDLKKINKQLKAFHKNRNISRIKEKNRRIWLEYLTMGGFFSAEYNLLAHRYV